MTDREYLFEQLYLKTFHPELADWHDDRPMTYYEDSPRDTEQLYKRQRGEA